MNTINNMPMPITIFGRFNMKWTMKWVVTFELYLFLPSLLFLRKRKKSKQHSSIKLVKLCHSFFGIYFLSANMACFVVVAVWRLFFSSKKKLFAHCLIDAPSQFEYMCVQFRFIFAVAVALFHNDICCFSFLRVIFRLLLLLILDYKWVSHRMPSIFCEGVRLGFICPKCLSAG